MKEKDINSLDHTSRRYQYHKVSELKYILARKESKIKSLEMENELLLDFLSLSERK